MALQLANAPIAQAGMLIHKPVNEVHEAFIDPDITTKFWFTKSSGKLDAGKVIRGEWEMYGVASLVHVRELEAGKRILHDWGLDAQSSTVEWTFTPHGKGVTFVNIPTQAWRVMEMRSWHRLRILKLDSHWCWRA